MNNINLIFYNKLNIITFKRCINNEHLKKALNDLLLTNSKNNINVNNSDISEALSKLNVKENVKQDPIVYDDILKNIQESEFLLNNVKSKLKIAKDKSLDITLDVKDVDLNVQNQKIVDLNSNNVFYQNDKIQLDKTKKDSINIDIGSDHLISNKKKIESNSLFDFD
jgi:hypothetical protein